VIDAAGRTVESRSLVFDVTAQQEAEAAGRRSERRFRAAFVDAPIGVALLNEGGRMVAASTALVGLLGVDEATALDQPLAAWVSPEHVDCGRNFTAPQSVTR
jgi:two-component system cell cycle sensor histidine kinase/response regulator CckA